MKFHLDEIEIGWISFQSSTFIPNRIQFEKVRFHGVKRGSQTKKNGQLKRRKVRRTLVTLQTFLFADAAGETWKNDHPGGTLPGS